MGRHCPKAHKIQPVEKPYKISLPKYKKKAEKIIKDFCLTPDICKALIKKVEEAKTEHQVDLVLKEARNYI